MCGEVKMQIGEISEIQISDFFELVEQEGGTYEVETPQGWVEIGNLKREEKECFLLRTAGGLTLGASNDHLVETKNGWQKVEDFNIEQTEVITKYGDDKIIAREYIGSRITFDVEVLNDEHKYYTNGIVSHNSGKTMVCKWLRQHCIRKELEYKIVTTEDYRNALNRGSLDSIFELPASGKGIIFCDDMDILFQDRNSGNPNLFDFLTRLDGIEATEGVVFVFTSNRIQELDEAFVRPGRIDLFLLFDSPDEKLRRRFVVEFFHPDILKQVDVEDIVTRTAKSNTNRDDDSPYTFAELEEIRKLLSMDLIDGKSINIDKIFKEFELHRKEFKERGSRLGFGSLRKKEHGRDDDDIFYDDMFITPPWEL